MADQEGGRGEGQTYEIEVEWDGEKNGINTTSATIHQPVDQERTRMHWINNVYNV